MRILEIAQALLQKRGYNGFSYRHLAQELGIKTAAVHYHFPVKADLSVELVNQFRKALQQWSTSIDSHVTGALDRLDAFSEMHAAFLDQKVPCPAGILEAEYGPLPDRMCSEVQAFASEVHGWLARTLQQGRDSGEMVFPGDPDDQAVVIGATVQGALQMARAFNKDRYYTATLQLKKLISRRK